MHTHTPCRHLSGEFFIFCLQNCPNYDWSQWNACFSCQGKSGIFFSLLLCFSSRWPKKEENFLAQLDIFWWSRAKECLGRIGSACSPGRRELQANDQYRTTNQIYLTLNVSSRTQTTLELESPIQVLTKLNFAWLQWSYKNWYFQVGVFWASSVWQTLLVIILGKVIQIGRPHDEEWITIFFFLFKKSHYF